MKGLIPRRIPRRHARWSSTAGTFVRNGGCIKSDTAPFLFQRNLVFKARAKSMKAIEALFLGDPVFVDAPNASLGKLAFFGDRYLLAQTPEVVGSFAVHARGSFFDGLQRAVDLAVAYRTLAVTMLQRKRDDELLREVAVFRPRVFFSHHAAFVEHEVAKGCFGIVACIFGFIRGNDLFQVEGASFAAR